MTVIGFIIRWMVNYHLIIAILYAIDYESDKDIDWSFLKELQWEDENE